MSTLVSSTMIFGAAAHSPVPQTVRRMLGALRNHVSTSAALQLASVAIVVAAANQDTPLDVRTSPRHFTGFSLLVSVLVLVPILDGLQLLLHSRAVHSERVLLDSVASASAGDRLHTADVSPTVLLPERAGTLRAYTALTATRAQSLEACLGGVLLDCACFIGRIAAAAAKAGDSYHSNAPPPLRRALWLLKQAAIWFLALTFAMGIVFGAPTEQDAFLSAHMSAFAAMWAVRACALAFCASATAFVSLHWLTTWIYERPAVADVLSSPATAPEPESLLDVGQSHSRATGSTMDAVATGQHDVGQESREPVSGDTGVARDRSNSCEVDGSCMRSSAHSRPQGRAAIIFAAASKPLTEWQVLP